MDKAALVSTDVDIGAKIAKALDQSDLGVSVAMWLNTPEYGDWRFALSSRRLDQVGGARAYGLVHDALESAGVPLERTPALWIMAMSDPFVRELRRTFGKAKNVEGMRLGGQVIGNRFVEDAVVYRIR